MEFWGVEVKAGEPLKVTPQEFMVVHVSQACLGESKAKGNDSVCVSVKVDDKKFVLSHLSLDKFPQVTLDLVFDKEFELSHNWKHGSIYLCGYETEVGGDGDDSDFNAFDSASEEEEDVVPAKAAAPNGKAVVAMSEKSKPAKAVAADKPKVKVVEPVKEESDDSDGLEDDSDDDSDNDMLMGEDSSEDDDDSDDESDEETPKKPESSKKRPSEAAPKTPVSSKKAKITSPKSDGKKVGGHTATPHPSKKVVKTPAPVTPATAGKSKGKAQTPKSGGSSEHSCKPCSKNFNSDKALESHNKAKHA